MDEEEKDFTCESDEKIALCLKVHNLWRRGELDDMPFSPNNLGLLLDEAAKRLERRGKETANV